VVIETWVKHISLGEGSSSVTKFPAINSTVITLLLFHTILLLYGRPEYNTHLFHCTLVTSTQG
jgi:hypothetical protein